MRASSADEEERALHPRLVALVPAFLEARRRDVQSLNDALGRRDHASVAHLAHTLKGTGGSYGFRLISESGARLESAMRAGDETAARAELAELDAYIARLALRHLP
jgi:HPt (histidine-containing phosphotransfer) domain-containing protein